MDDCADYLMDRLMEVHGNLYGQRAARLQKLHHGGDQRGMPGDPLDTGV